MCDRATKIKKLDVIIIYSLGGVRRSGVGKVYTTSLHKTSKGQVGEGTCRECYLCGGTKIVKRGKFSYEKEGPPPP